MQKTLYISDLDGTLLQPNERLSAFGCQTINQLVKSGMLFSYATARSYHTAKKCTAGLDAKIPLIVYNGALIVDNQTGDILTENIFSPQQASDIYTLLRQCGIHPIVYSLINGVEKFSYDQTAVPLPTRNFLDQRRGDGRDHPLTGDEHILNGKVYYFTCIDETERLLQADRLIREQFGDICNQVCQKDIYSGDQWLEIMPASASKAHATRQLKELTGAEKMVAFGDGPNDLPLFDAADEGYAVENAHPLLKSAATSIIGLNTNDGVARWLLEHFTGHNL